MAYTTPSKYHYTVEEQRDRLPLYLREFYRRRQLDRIRIDGVEIQGYFEYSFIEEKTYVKSPERSADGSILNLNSYATFMTPRLVIKYNYMHIEDYRKLMTLLSLRNEFTVECYDIVKDDRVVHKMYHAPAEMPKIHQRYLEVLGVRDYTVELIGTNASLEEVEIRYYDEYGVLIPEATQTVTKGLDAVIDYDYIASTGKKFVNWVDKNNVQFWNKQKVDTLTDNLNLYAEVQPSGMYTLSFNYGNGNTLYSQSAGAVTQVDILVNDSISTAINKANITLDDGTKFTFPENGTGSLKVLYENEYKEPYEFKGWYWTPTAVEGMRVYGSTLYGNALNRTIYQVYEPKTYWVTYDTNSNKQIQFDDQDVAYGTKVPLPALRMSGYTFIGWYTDPAFKKAFSGTMPPKDITLYAKWEKNG